jgi:beclin 1
MKTSAVLFDILSSRSDIDHPICQECSDLLTEGLTKRLANVTRERDAYVDHLRRVSAEIPTDAEREAATRELEMLKSQAEAELRELQDMERERAVVEAETRRLEEEKMKLDEEEVEFWRERNSFARRLEEFQNERDGVNLQYDHDSRQLEKLQRTNVYNDTFCIGHDGYFGTINGLRLGRLPNQPVCHPALFSLGGGPPFVQLTQPKGRMDRDQRGMGANPPPSGHNRRKTQLYIRLIPAQADGIQLQD